MAVSACRPCYRPGWSELVLTEYQLHTNHARTPTVLCIPSRFRCTSQTCLFHTFSSVIVCCTPDCHAPTSSRISYANYFRQGGYVFIGVCLFVCLFVVSRITQQLLNRSSQNSMERWHTDHGKKQILVVIYIRLR